jgi:hypothetical protein
MDNWEPVHIIVKRYLGMLPEIFQELSTDAASIWMQ